MKEKEMVVDMAEHGEKYLIAKGGKGGKGNFHFRSSTNQTPKEFEPGHPGEEKWLLMELKVVADVGIVGLPNVGKSSLLKALTNANPKIAGYPFTTLEPNLGVASVNDKKIVIVDVPGVVEDAWEGKGIGPWFLRHLERTKMLVHVLAIDVTRQHVSTSAREIAEQLAQDYQIVRKEFEKYGKGLVEKLEIVVVNKMELVDPEMRREIDTEFDKLIHKSLVWVSAGMGEVWELEKKLG
jgi:GTP-binding protein